MGATASIIGSWFGAGASAGAVGGTGLTASAAAGGLGSGLAAATGTGMGLSATAAAGGLGTGLAAATGTGLGMTGVGATLGGGLATAGGIGAGLLKSAASGAGTAATARLLQPKVPQLPGPTQMPDPEASAEAAQRSIIEQLSRRGRAASILTDTSQKLGG